jgi:hypothetical protein
MALFLCANIHQGHELFSVHSGGKKLLLCHEFTALLTARNIPIINNALFTSHNVLSFNICLLCAKTMSIVFISRCL